MILIFKSRHFKTCACQSSVDRWTHLLYMLISFINILKDDDDDVSECSTVLSSVHHWRENEQTNHVTSATQLQKSFLTSFHIFNIATSSYYRHENNGSKSGVLQTWHWRDILLLLKKSKRHDSKERNEHCTVLSWLMSLLQPESV